MRSASKELIGILRHDDMIFSRGADRRALSNHNPTYPTAILLGTNRLNTNTNRRKNSLDRFQRGYSTVAHTQELFASDLRFLLTLVDNNMINNKKTTTRIGGRN